VPVSVCESNSCAPSIRVPVVIYKWSHYADVDLTSAAAATDNYVEVNPVSLDAVEATRRVFDHLLDLPPMTPENAFSGNLAPIVEAGREITASITLARMGLYKQALASLRSVLELGLLAVYWDADDQSHVDIQSWWRGNDKTPMSHKVWSRLEGIREVAAYVKLDPEFFNRARDLSSALSNYVHTRGGRHSAGGLVSTNIPTFSETAFMLWQDHLIDVGRTVLAMHLMKYPVGLQITPLSEKFGLNPPAGGFIEPTVREFFRNYLQERIRDSLQEHSDRDEDALARAAWVNNQPDLSEKMRQEQAERHDRLWIEMGGFESWAATREKVDEDIAEYLTKADRQERRSYRLRLQQWAEAEGYLTSQSAFETQMRKACERQAEDDDRDDVEEDI
jgi:hypothetical protein